MFSLTFAWIEGIVKVNVYDFNCTNLCDVERNALKNTIYDIASMQDDASVYLCNPIGNGKLLYPSPN